MMSYDTGHISGLIKSAAKEAGFDDCGIAKAELLKEDGFRLTDWLKNGFHADMKYMETHFGKRTNLQKLVPGARSVISVILNYLPERSLKEKNNLIISKYAYGTDYHYVVKAKLNALLKIINDTIVPVNGRAFVDSAPVLDRAWAGRAGIGWIGKNTNLISVKYGSFVFIGSLVVDIELEYDKPIPDHCGGCRKCIDACPTGALIADKVLDSNKCISYLTIENRNEIPPQYKNRFRDRIFGCDICQDVCPWNRKVKPHRVPEFEAKTELLQMNREQWEKLDKPLYNRLFKKSAVKRAKFEGLKRNIEYVSDES